MNTDVKLTDPDPGSPIPLTGVADLYHFDTDPDPGYEKICYGSGSRANFDTDPDSDPGKNDTDPDPAKKELSTRNIFKK